MDTLTSTLKEEARVSVLKRYGILDTPREDDFDDLCRLAARLCDTPVAALNFIDDEREWFKAEIGLDVRELPLGNSPCMHTLLEEETMVVPDTLADPRFRNHPAYVDGPKLRFYAGAVIRSPEGFAIGTVCVLDTRPRQIEPAQLQDLRTVAKQVVTMLELRRQTAEAKHLATMRGQISVVLGNADPLRTVLGRCAQTLVEQLDGAFARVWTLEEAEQTLVMQASAGMYTHLDGPHGRVKVGDFKIGRIARDRRALLTNDVRHDPNIGDPAWAAREGMVAFAGHPLLVDDRVVGVLAIFWRHPVSAALLNDLAPIADGIAQCIDRKNTEVSLQRREQTARFLAQASADMAEVLDHQSTLQKIASTSVPAFADWCTVDLLDAEGQLRRVAASHVDPVKEGLLLKLRRRFPPSTDDPHGVGAVLRTGEPEMVTNVPAGLYDRMARDGEHLRLLRALAPRSFLCVPVIWRGKVLGALTYVHAESGRRYTPLDLLVATDLARRAAVAMENAHLYSELRDADQRKDEFLATLAHELRNPLAPLRNALTLLQSAEHDPQTVVEARDTMDRQVQQMVRLVDDLLDVSRITRGRIELRKTRVRLDEIIHSAVEISRALVDRPGHALTIELPPAPVYLDADLTRLAQVFSNLLNNAAKYTPDGGKILLSAKLVEDGRVRVSVRDNGSGIEPEMLPRVFDLFAQEDRSLERAQGGLGIGLSLVRRLVELHGGRVEAHSAGRGRGSEFSVKLPVATEAAPAPLSARTVPSASQPQKARRILVVDDNRDAATTLTKLLRRRGHTVETVFDGEEAVRMAGEFHPEVVLLDIGLPKLNGYDAAEQIRRQSGHTNLTLIALTGWGQEEDIRRAREAGFTHHLTKPVMFEELFGLLSKASPPGIQ